ncbi:proton-coupled folate transporter [Patella vulgata]|uniref:proton-coupled folate transporter n=1 Tax=Patella vulgata TaxID=6465 RepID=UPI00218045F0|nr:proton-coupled folate transporter [Patella vulgata]
MAQAGVETEPKCQKCWHYFDTIQKYFVEVALFFFFLSRHMTLPLFQEYVSEEIHKQHHVKFLEMALEMNQANLSMSIKEAEHDSALSILGLQIAEGLPAVITVIILGAVSDRTGRRRIMLWLPCLGSVLYCLIYVLLMYTGWNLDGLFMASAFRGLSGSMTAFLAGATYFGINSVKPHERVSRLAIQEFLNGGAYAIANIMVGFWVKDSGFLEPYWFALICSMIALLISYFLIQEIPQNRDSPNRRRDTGNCLKDTFTPIMKYFKCGQNKPLIKIWLATLAFQSYALVHIGQENTMVMFLGGQKYLHQTHLEVTGLSVSIGVFLSVIMVVAALATALTPALFKRFLSDTTIIILGFLSKALGTLWIAVVQNETVLYFAILLLAFELLPFPMLRSLVSRDIAPADQGSLFALMHCGESLIFFLGPLMFTAIYAGTLHYYRATVLIVSIILLVLPVSFTLGLKFLAYKKPEDYEPMEESQAESNIGGEQRLETREPSEISSLANEPISFIQLSANNTSTA